MSRVVGRYEEQAGPLVDDGGHGGVVATRLLGIRIMALSALSWQQPGKLGGRRAFLFGSFIKPLKRWGC